MLCEQLLTSAVFDPAGAERPHDGQRVVVQRDAALLDVGVLEAAQTRDQLGAGIDPEGPDHRGEILVGVGVGARRAGRSRQVEGAPDVLVA